MGRDGYGGTACFAVLHFAKFFATLNGGALRFEFIEQDASFPFAIAFREETDGLVSVLYRSEFKDAIEPGKKFLNSPLARAFVKSLLGDLVKVPATPIPNTEPERLPPA